MNGLTHATRKPALLVSVLLGGVIFTSCATNQQASQPASEAQVDMSAPAPGSQLNNAVKEAPMPADQAPVQAAQVPRSRPQLIKKATMTVIVDSVDQSIQTVSAIIDKQQGDLIGLQDQKPKGESDRHTASMQMRIPQNLLEPTLDELAKLGTVENRTITADDVGDQLVDYQARLTNLRKTESNLLKIMDRAGSVRDVLSVSNELSQVRQSIEQISAQLKSLQNQVAYSTITLKLEAAVSSTSPQPALGSRVQETWNNSTHSFGEFNIGLLRLGIWLIVYSPFLLLLAAAGYGFTRLRRSNSRPLTQTPESPNAD